MTTATQEIDPGPPPPPFPDLVRISCAPNYCLRFRPAARSPQVVDTGMSHLGLRRIVRAAAP